MIVRQSRRQRAQLPAPVGGTKQIAFDDAEPFHVAGHYLRACQQGSDEPQEHPSPGPQHAADKVGGDYGHTSGGRIRLRRSGISRTASTKCDVTAMKPRENRSRGKKARNILNAMAWHKVTQSGKIRTKERTDILEHRVHRLGRLYGKLRKRHTVLLPGWLVFYCRRKHSRLNCGRP